MDNFIERLSSHDSENLFGSILRSAPVGVGIINNENKLLFGNIKFFNILQHDEKDIINKDICTIFNSFDPHSLRNDTKSKKTIIDFTRKNGKHAKAELSLLNYREEKKNLLYFVLFINELQFSREEVFKKQFFNLSIIVEQIPSSIVITDTDGNIQYVNPAFSLLTGYSIEEILGKNIMILKSGKVPSNIYDDLWKTVQSGKTWKGELIDKKKNGELCTELTIITPLKEKNNKVNYYIVIKEDITLLKQQNKKLQESEKLTAIGKMASYLLHEIKSPFSSIKMNFDLLKNEIKENLVSYNIIEREIKRLDKILKEVLQYSREKELEIVKVNLHKTIGYVSSMMETILGEKNITFFNNVEPVTINADSQQLQSLFLFLLENSIEAVDNKGIIETRSESNDNNIVIFFKDNGSGIDESISSKIFEPFFTNKAKGSGLGLALAKKIIEKHGGVIELLPCKKNDTTFRIIIPKGA